jgi:putative ABC transport system permease protein
MRTLLRLLPVRNLRRQALRSVVTVLGAACGVALFVSIEIINASTLRYFADGIRAMAGGAALTVTASETGFPQSAREPLLSLPGVRAAVPSIETLAYVLRPGRTEPDALAVLGVDPSRELLVRTHRLEHGGPAPAPLLALERADTILMPPGGRRSAKPEAEESIDVLTPAGVQRLVVIGTLASAGGDEAGYAVIGLQTAQRLFGYDNRITRLDILVDDGQDIDALTVTIRHRLGPAYTVASSRAREADMQRLVRGYQALLRFVSLVTLLAGAMILGATMNVSVREQRKSIGVLRALGSSRLQTLGLVLVQAAVLSAAAVALGMFGGRLVAEGLVDAVSRTMANTYMIPIRPGALVYPLDMAVTQAAFAWLVGLAAALVSAIQAARMDPALAIRATDIEADLRAPRWLAWSGTAGGLLMAYLGVVVILRLDRDLQTWQSVNAAVGLLAALLLQPWLAIAGLRRLRRTLVGQRGMDRWPVLRLAVGNVLRAPTRSAWNVLLLSIGLLMFVAVDTLHHSLLSSIEGWLDRTVYSDLLVASPGRLFTMEVQPLSEDLAPRIDAVAGVRVDDARGAMAIRYATVRYAGRDLTVKAFDRPHASLTRLPFDLRSDHGLIRGGNIFDGSRPAALVSENFVRHFGKRPGDRLTLDSPPGPLELDIIGVVTDFASPDGVVYLTRDLYRTYWHDRLVSVYSVMVVPGVPLRRVAEAIEASVGGARGVQVTNNRQLRQQTSDILNESFAYTRAIEAAALIAAVFGIMNSMMTAVLARQREVAVLRAIGLSRPRVLAMVVCEGLCLAMPAALGAALLGGLLGYLCLAGVLSALMGWTLQFHVSPWTLTTTLLLGVISGSAASAAAAWRCAKLQVSDALAAQ